MPVATETERQHSPDAIGRFTVWLFSTPRWLLIASWLVVSAALYGFRPVRHISRLSEVARHPYEISVPDGDSYLYQSPIGPLVAHYTGMTHAAGFALVAIIATFACLVAVAAYVSRRTDDYTARLLIVAFFCSPHAAMAVNHLGMLDILIVGGATLVMVGSAPVAFVAAAMMGFNHFDQSGFIIAVSAVLRLWVRRERPAPIVAAAAGLLLGRLGLAAYLDYHDMVIPTTRAERALSDPGQFFRVWRGQLPVVIFSVYNVLWVPMFCAWRRLEPLAARVLFGLQVALLVPVLVVNDLTRVYAMLTWPLVVFVGLWWAGRPERAAVRRWAAWLLLAGVFVPRVNVTYVDVIVSRWDRF